MDEGLLQVASVVISFLIGSFLIGLTQYRIFKQKLNAFRETIDAIDDALQDDTITVDELKEILSKLRRLL